MCDECGRQICPSACPGHSGARAGLGDPLARCSICGVAIYRGECWYDNGFAVICAECSRYIEIDELALAAGADSRGELFEICGFSKRES